MPVPNKHCVAVFGAKGKRGATCRTVPPLSKLTAACTQAPFCVHTTVSGKRALGFSASLKAKSITTFVGTSLP